MTSIQQQKEFADYVFRGTTQSLCPKCLKLVSAKIIVRDQRVYFKKSCPDCGPREDFVCSDVRYYDRLEYSVPSKIPVEHGVEPQQGCPYDCGLCTEHEQHTCVALVELTSNCNLKCPMCFASSGPGGEHLSFEQCRAAIDRIVQLEGGAEIIQLSGGEPTLHPEFLRVLEYAVAQKTDYVHINTNGIRLAKDLELVKAIAQHRQKVEIFFQFDGLAPEVTRQLRGEDLLEAKLQAIENLGQAGLNLTLAVTLQGGVNDNEIGNIVDFAVARPWVTGINFQPATYSGRHVLPDQLENRITFPDVIKAIARESSAGFVVEDFLPLPCAHPNCHSIGLGYRQADQVIPVNRFIDVTQHLDLLANGISFTRKKSGELVAQLINELACGPSCSHGTSASAINDSHQESSDRSEFRAIGQEFLQRAVANKLGARDLFRITITSFLDAYNFDLRRLMKCCTHHVLPSGHVIPFCAYNVLYREGHVALPALKQLSQTHQ